MPNAAEEAEAVLGPQVLHQHVQLLLHAELHLLLLFLIFHVTIFCIVVLEKKKKYGFFLNSCSRHPYDQ